MTEASCSRRAFARVQPVQAGGDQGVERLGHGEGGEVADRMVRAIGQLEPAVVDEHADRLDGVERDALRSVDDRVRGRVR